MFSSFRVHIHRRLFPTTVSDQESNPYQLLHQTLVDKSILNILKKEREREGVAVFAGVDDGCRSCVVASESLSVFDIRITTYAKAPAETKTERKNKT
jgi:hypothetical protein